MSAGQTSAILAIGLTGCVSLFVCEANAAGRVKLTSGGLLDKPEVHFQCPDVECYYVVDFIVDGVPRKATLKLHFGRHLVTMSIDAAELKVRLNGEPQVIMPLDEGGFGRGSFEVIEPLPSAESEKPNSGIQAVVRAPKRRLGGITVEIFPVH